MKKLLSVVLSAVMLSSMLAGFSVMAQATETSTEDSTETSSVNSADIGKNKTSGDYNYILLNDGTAEITKYSGNETNLSVPSTIDGYTVTSLGMFSFKNGNFESVTIPDTITKLDYAAFSNCSNLTDITLPDSITDMPDSVFSDTAYFNDKKNWEGDLLYIGNYLVGADPSISGECTIKSGTTMISARIPTVYDPEDAPALTSLTIPSSVKYINKDSFVLCSRIEKINIENNKYFHLVDGVMFETNDNTLIKYPSLSENSSYTIPDGTTSIGASAFMYSSNLTSIAIPNSVKRIDDYAFNWCKSLTDISIPDSVTSVGGYAFSKCRGLTNIAIPDSVTLIDESAFSYCSNLTTVVIPESITSISMYAFTGCSNLPYITIPDSVTSIGVHAFSGCINLKAIAIPENVTSIGDLAFSRCHSLTNITIPENVTSVGMHPFFLCKNLKKVTVMNPDIELHFSNDSDGDIIDKKLFIKLHKTEGSTDKEYVEYYGVRIVTLGIAVGVVAILVTALLVAIKKRNKKKAIN